jgi:hypothetical protein
MWSDAWGKDISKCSNLQYYDWWLWINDATSLALEVLNRMVEHRCYLICILTVLLSNLWVKKAR